MGEGGGYGRGGVRGKRWGAIYCLLNEGRWRSSIFLQCACSLNCVRVGVRAADVMSGRDWIAAGFLTESPTVKVIWLHGKCGSPAPLTKRG